jgi:hypothetical protein
VPVLIHFNGDPEISTQPGEGVPGTTQRIYATAPAGATAAEIVIGTAPAAAVSRAGIGRLGREC